MKLREWFALRGPVYLGKRAATLRDRYGISPSQAASRVKICMATLAEHGCAPTFPTPGRVVQRYPQILRQLQDAGAEIAVHGFDHVDLTAYPPTEACEQLLKASQVFARHGIDVHGFRCPYLRCNDDLLDTLPQDTFDYSSNKAIRWDVVVSARNRNAAMTLNVLHRLYKPTSALREVCTPRTRSNLVEIPVCLPDDLELHDGLQLGPEGMARTWSQILHQTHQRGELFVLVFHPELAWYCQQPFIAILREAAGFRPPVWIARLRDISSWWREKSSFAVTVSPTAGGQHISFACSERATILIKGLGSCSREYEGCFEPLMHSEIFEHSKLVEEWDGTYYRLRSKTLQVPVEPRPFVGLPADAPARIVSFLREQGYILDLGKMAMRCGTYIDAAALNKLKSEVELIETIEASPGPLVRYWRWPDGAKSALSVTGDLDALSLLDYASRLLGR